MSRDVLKIDHNTSIIFCDDPMGIHGSFVQVYDKRWAELNGETGDDGYLLDFDSIFGFSTNLIGATLAGLKQDTCVEYIKELVDAFIAGRTASI